MLPCGSVGGCACVCVWQSSIQHTSRPHHNLYARSNGIIYYTGFSLPWLLFTAPCCTQVHVCEQLPSGQGQCLLLQADGSAARSGQRVHTGRAGSLLRRTGPQDLQTGLTSGSAILCLLASPHLQLSTIFSYSCPQCLLQLTLRCECSIELSCDAW